MRTKFAREVRRGDLVICHAKSGWTTSRVAIEYLRWVAEWFNGKMDWPDYIEDPDELDEEEEEGEEATIWDQLMDDESEMKHSVCVLWDLYSAHRQAGVIANAPVHLEFIPGGLTDEYQPLHRRIFGALKKMAHARMDSWLRSHSASEMDISVPIRVLLDSWAAITEDQVKSASSHLITYEDE